MESIFSNAKRFVHKLSVSVIHEIDKRYVQNAAKAEYKLW